MGIHDRRKREKEKRGEKILNVARRIFLKKGIHDTTMEDIARESELGKGTIYLYYKNKEELVYSIMYKSFLTVKEMMEEVASLDLPGIERIRKLEEVVIRYYAMYSDYFMFTKYFDFNFTAGSEEGSAAYRCSRLIDEFVDLFAQVIRDGVSDGSIRKDIEPEMTAVIYANIIMSFIYKLHDMGKIINQRMRLSPEELIRHMLDIIVYALH